MNAQIYNKIVFTEDYLELIHLTMDLIESYPKNQAQLLISNTKQSLYKGLQYLMYADSEKKNLRKINYLKKTLHFIHYQENLIDLAYYNKYFSYDKYKRHCQITNMLNKKINYAIYLLHSY